MCTYREVLLYYVKVDKADCEPGHQSEHRDDDDEGHKVSTEPVGKLLDRSLNKQKQPGREKLNVLQANKVNSSQNIYIF